MRRIAAMLAALVVAVGALSSAAFGASPAPSPAGTEVRSEAPVGRGLGITVLAGMALPTCRGGSECYGSFGAVPSLQALVLYQPNETWAFGLAGQVERIHWAATATSMIDGTPYSVETDATAAFVGLAARFVPLPALRFTPVIQFALGSAFQQKGEPWGCGHGATPAAQFALGGRARVGSSVSVFAMASARAAMGESCIVFDAASMPLAGWGFGFHAGAAFDIALGQARPATPIAAR